MQGKSIACVVREEYVPSSLWWCPSLHLGGGASWFVHGAPPHIQRLWPQVRFHPVALCGLSFPVSIPFQLSYCKIKAPKKQQKISQHCKLWASEVSAPLLY